MGFIGLVIASRQSVDQVGSESATSFFLMRVHLAQNYLLLNSIRYKRAAVIIPFTYAIDRGFARQVGYRQLILWTNSILVPARRIYEQAGFVLVAAEPHHSFGHDLVGETWVLTL